MAGGVDSFVKRIAKVAVEVQENAEREVRKVAMAIDSALVTATPVDTGRARSNWLASIGAPRTDTVPPDPSPASVFAEAEQAIAGYRSGDSIFFANNLPYIVELNGGSSAQAPANFVEAAVAVGARAVKTAKVLK